MFEVCYTPAIKGQQVVIGLLKHTIMYFFFSFLILFSLVIDQSIRRHTLANIIELAVQTKGKVSYNI